MACLCTKFVHYKLMFFIVSLSNCMQSFSASRRLNPLTLFISLHRGRFVVVHPHTPLPPLNDEVEDAVTFTLFCFSGQNNEIGMLSKRRSWVYCVKYMDVIG